MIGSLSIATDLAMGQPMAFMLRSCAIAVELGSALGYDDVELARIYYQALLRYVGCNAETDTLAALFGDELAMRRDFATIDGGNVAAVMRFAARHISRAAAGEGRLRMAGIVRRGTTCCSSSRARARCCRKTGSIARASRWLTSPTSSRRTRWGIHAASPSSPPAQPRAAVWAATTRPPCAVRACCTTSARSGSRARSGASPDR